MVCVRDILLEAPESLRRYIFDHALGNRDYLAGVFGLQRFSLTRACDIYISCVSSNPAIKAIKVLSQSGNYRIVVNVDCYLAIETRCDKRVKILAGQAHFSQRRRLGDLDMMSVSVNIMSETEHYVVQYAKF